jgi:hypothetical protein
MHASRAYAVLRGKYGATRPTGGLTGAGAITAGGAVFVTVVVTGGAVLVFVTGGAVFVFVFVFVTLIVIGGRFGAFVVDVVVDEVGGAGTGGVSTGGGGGAGVASTGGGGAGSTGVGAATGGGGAGSVSPGEPSVTVCARAGVARRSGPRMKRVRMKLLSGCFPPGCRSRVFPR